MGNLWQDLRYGGRVLLKSPAFSVIALLALTVGIGANTAIFSVVQTVLLRPLPFKEQDQLVVAWKRDTTASNELVELSYPEYEDWRSQSQIFEDLAAMPTTVYGYGYILTGQGEPTQVESVRVTANFFSLIGASPALGRTFTPEENQPGGSPVVVLNNRFWRSRFNADPNILDKTITLNGIGFRVIGVMPQDFDFPKGADVFTLLATTPRLLANRNAVFLQAIGRLKPGKTQEQARAELNTIIAHIAQAHPETQGEGQSVVVTPLADYVFGNARPALYLLLAASGLLLLIACANIANLLLARATTRSREIAVRAALGASYRRLVHQFLTESFLLAVIGGLFGLLLAYVLMKLFVRLAPLDIPRLSEVHLSIQVLVFTSVVTLLTTVLFGLVPAFIASRTDLNDSLREGGVRVAGNRHGNTVRQGLIIAEVAITLVLLIAAGLIFKSFMVLRQVQLGFEPQQVLTMQLSLQGPKYAQPDKRREFFHALQEHLEGQSGVVAVGAILIRPLEGPIGWDVPYMTEGQSLDDVRKNSVPNFEVVTPHYFKAMGIPLIAGRDFTEQDTAQSPQVVIVSQTMAQRIFSPQTNPLGQRIKLEPSDSESPWREVVGIVGDARYRQIGDFRLDVYVPYRQNPVPLKYLTIRTTVEPEALTSMVRSAVAALDPDQATTSVMTGEQLVSRAIARPRFNALLLSFLAIIAALLAMIGIYGIVTYTVTQRTREIGIRIALGAKTLDVLKLIVGQGMRLVLLGIGAGLIIAFVTTRLMSQLLYDTSPTDRFIFVAVPLLLAAVALLGCLVPTRKATKVDPIIVLHYE